MKTTAVIALAAMTLAVAGCTTSDPTPPGSLGALSEEEEGDEAEGIPNEDEREEGGAGEGAAGEAAEEEGAEEEGAGEDAAGQTASEPEGEGNAEEADEEPPSSGDLPDSAQMTDEVCVAFFEGAAPLAGRAQDSLLIVKRGSDNNLTALEYQEIDVLMQRLEELGAQADDEQAELIETINTPFLALEREVSENDARDADSGEVAYEAIDTEESAQAQEELTEACLSES